jgi:broad specificity phosphatase PhoE
VQGYGRGNDPPVSRLLLVAHAPTPAVRQAVFGRDDDLDEGGANAAAALRGTVAAGRAPWWCGPSRADLHTARQMGGDPVVVPGLADCDYGTWAGLSLDQVAARDPGGLQAWMGDPQAVPHGGESLAALVARIGARLDDYAGDDAVLVVAPGVLRAALVHALGLPAAAMWQVDVAPLATTRFDHRGGRWRLHLTAARPASAAQPG